MRSFFRAARIGVLSLAFMPMLAHALDVTVSAAASLREAFSEIGRAFEKDNTPHRVLFNFGASGQLVQQINRGAPVDVLATADQDSMDRAQKQNLIVRETRANFARNRMVLAVAADGGPDLRSLDELKRSDVERIAVGNPDSVPAGRYAKSALEAAGLWQAITPKLVYTQNVRQSLDYVARGETQAGFVYLTDQLLMPFRVKAAFEVPTREPIVYPVAVVKGGGNARLGEMFVRFVQSEPARRILVKYGFLEP